MKCLWCGQDAGHRPWCKRTPTGEVTPESMKDLLICLQLQIKESGDERWKLQEDNWRLEAQNRNLCARLGEQARRVKDLEEVLLKVHARDRIEVKRMVNFDPAGSDYEIESSPGPLAQLAAEALLPYVAPCGGANGGGEDCFAGCEYRLRCPNISPEGKKEFRDAEGTR